MIDQELVRRLRVQVAERLNEQRRRDQVNGVPPMSAEDTVTRHERPKVERHGDAVLEIVGQH